MAGSSRIYGIDLGTTYSCIAYVDDSGKPVVIPNSEGALTTPSVVYFEGPDSIVVGSAAKDIAELKPDLVVSSVKRAMGDPDSIYEFDGNVYRPQAVSSFILRKLIADAAVITGDDISDVVITCPAYFGTTEIEATREAGLLAGLNVRYVIPEPTAAALSYGIEQTEDQVVMVFDLGGGTFDITVIDISDESIRVVCTGGNHDLGGKNWDETIAAWAADELADKTGNSPDEITGDLEAWQELLIFAEKAKVALSSRDSYAAKLGQVDRAAVELTRDQFDALTGHLLTRTISLTTDLLDVAQEKGCKKIDKLLLVGGSTYMPQVIDAVNEEFDFEVRHHDPNQAVAKGAAIYGWKCYLQDEVVRLVAEHTGESEAEIEIDTVAADVIESAEKEVAREHGLSLPALRSLNQKKISNVSSKSFGIVVMDSATDSERVTNLIVAQEPVPKTTTKTFYTHADNQPGVTLQCMENVESSGPEDGLLALESSVELGVSQLRFLKPLPKGSPIEVTFSLGEDGSLSVKGMDLTTNQAMDVQYETDALLPDIDEKKASYMAITVT